MSNLHTYLIIVLISCMGISNMLKLSCLSLKLTGVASVGWGIVAYFCVRYASETANLQNGLLFNPDLMLTLTFIDSGLLIAYSLKNSSPKRDNILSKTLSFYPGISLFFPVCYMAVWSIIRFTGISFATLGTIYGLAVAILVISISWILKIFSNFAFNKYELIYYFCLAIFLSGIILSGLQTS